MNIAEHKRKVKETSRWPRTYLRTISLLERVNENVRRRARVARACNSDSGILAMGAQVAHRWRQSNIRD